MSQQKKQKQQFKYHNKQKIELHPMINLLTQLTNQCQPYMPTLLSRKIAEDNGLDISQNTMALLFSHICDYKIMNIMQNIKEFKQNKKNGIILTKADIVKMLNCQGIYGIDRNNVYPLFGQQSKKDQQFQFKQFYQK